MASAAEPVLRAHLAPSDRKARKARPGHKARQARAANVAHRDRKEPLAPLARRGLPVRKVIRVRRRPIASSPERTLLIA